MAKSKSEVFRFAINGREIFGIKKRRRDGRAATWKFTCPSWPEVMKRFPKAQTIEPVVEEFIRRELDR